MTALQVQVQGCPPRRAWCWAKAGLPAMRQNPLRARGRAVAGTEVTGAEPLLGPWRESPGTTPPVWGSPGVQPCPVVPHGPSPHSEYEASREGTLACEAF